MRYCGDSGFVIPDTTTSSRLHEAKDCIRVVVKRRMLKGVHRLCCLYRLF